MGCHNLGKLSTTLSDIAATFSTHASIIPTERHVKFKHVQVAADLLSRATRWTLSAFWIVPFCFRRTQGRYGGTHDATANASTRTVKPFNPPMGFRRAASDSERLIGSPVFSPMGLRRIRDVVFTCCAGRQV